MSLSCGLKLVKSRLRRLSCFAMGLFQFGVGARGSNKFDEDVAEIERRRKEGMKYRMSEDDSPAEKSEPEAESHLERKAALV